VSLSAESRQAAISGILAPRSVIVIGASAKRPASGNHAIRNLVSAGFDPASIHVVHPVATQIEGLPVISSITSAPAGSDVALLSIPGSGIITALHELEAIGTRAAIVPTAGLSPEVQAALETFAATSTISVHGNNCMGILNVSGHAPLWFYEGLMTDLPRGPIALVSQSGSAVFLTRSVEQQGFSRIFSTGNEIDLAATDYLAWLATDDSTEVVGLVVESIRDEAAFTEAVRALREAGKPLVALKVGRTDAGRRATLAHTGALVSSTAAVESYFDALDVPLVTDYDQLAVTLQLLAEGVRASGDRIAVITDSGGEAALAADLAAQAGISLPPFSGTTAAQLVELVPGGAVNNPYDAGASPLTTDEQYDEAYGVVASDPNVDATLIIIEGHGRVSDSEARNVGGEYSGAFAAAAMAGKPAVAVSSSSTSTHPLIQEAIGAPVVRGILNGLVALRATSRNRAAIPSLPPRPTGLPSPEVVSSLRSRLSQSPTKVVSAATSGELLRAYGISPVHSFVAQSADDAISWATGRYPVVAKVTSLDVAHRSDIGAVILDIETSDDLRSAYDTIIGNVRSAHPEARIDGIEVQQQLERTHEAVLGLTSDPALGASVVIGTGGVLVELLNDAASARVPVSSRVGAALLEATALSRLLGGYRGSGAPTPTAKLIDGLVRLSWLGHDMRDVVDEIDLNPVLVDATSGAISFVDALVSIHTQPALVKGAAS
jgi:acyl-CoA synthetase (NDP forming)